MEKYEELKEYMANKGNGKMPTRKDPLGVWCDGQVLEYNKFLAGQKPCYITQERVDLLNDIGFVWNRLENAWQRTYDDLKKYREENGHCHVPVNYGDKSLFRWIAKQRKKYKNYNEGKKPALSEEQIKLLEELDFFEASEVRLAKFQAQKENNKRKSSSYPEKSKSRGRPKSKTLIPKEAQDVMNMTSAPTKSNSNVKNSDDSKLPSSDVSSILHPSPLHNLMVQDVSMPQNPAETNEETAPSADVLPVSGNESDSSNGNNKDSYGGDNLSDDDFEEPNMKSV
jgi:hypothetical protein